MQAFGGRKKDKTPLTNDFGAAAWELMISCTNSNQFKWGAAHVGAAIAYMRLRKPEEMERCLNLVMAIRAENLADPDWLVENIDPNTCQLLHQTSQNPNIRAEVDSMQQYTLGLLTKRHARRKRHESRELLEKIAETQKDQPVGQLAHEVAMQIQWHANTNSAPPIVAIDPGGGTKPSNKKWLLWMTPLFAAAISLLLIKRKTEGSLK